MNENLEASSEELLFSISTLKRKLPWQKILLFVLCAIGVFVSVWRTTFDGAGWIECSVSTVILYVICMLAYNVYYTSSMDKARLTPRYTVVKDEHDGLVKRARVRQEDLKAFCEKKRAEIKEAYLRQLFSTTQIDYDFFLKNVVGKSVKEILAMRYVRTARNGKKKLVRYDRNTRHAMIRGVRFRAPQITAGRLLTVDYDDGATAERPLGRTGGEVRRSENVRAFLTRALTIFIGGWFSVEIVFTDTTVATLIARMIPVITSIIFGMIGGSGNIYNHTVAFIGRQNLYLDEFVTDYIDASRQIKEQENVNIPAPAPATDLPSNGAEKTETVTKDSEGLLDKTPTST